MGVLTLKTSLGFLGLAVAMAVLLFVPAGTTHYWQAWSFLAVFFGASLLITFYLLQHDPALLKRRLKGGPAAEKRTSQKVIMLFASIGFIGLLVVPALDHRFGWSSVPVYLTIAGYIVTAVGFYLVFLVYRENSFTSATIEIAEGQTVISTGPYARVRHPMYTGSLLYLGGMPFALGSYWGLLALGAIVPAIILRLLDEERFLAKNLPGYAEYLKRVRWRLIRGIF
jgi:protein-S-isoprenylcysteine O-methyltransferase Ste14